MKIAKRHGYSRPQSVRHRWFFPLLLLSRLRFPLLAPRPSLSIAQGGKRSIPSVHLDMIRVPAQPISNRVD